MIMDSIFHIIDTKIDSIEQLAKKASIIVINESLFKQMQQEMITRDSLQKHGVIRSPYALQVYRGVKVVPSQVAESVEVL